MIAQKSLLLFIFASLCLGCATNNYQKFYRPIAHETFPKTDTIQVDSYNKENLKKFVREGYVCMGISSFEFNGVATNEQAMKYGMSIGADLLLLDSTFIRTEEGVTPIVNYVPGTKSTTTTVDSYRGSATSYGSGGYAHATGSINGTSTSYTTTSGKMNSTYQPYKYNVNKYSAYYYKKK